MLKPLLIKYAVKNKENSNSDQWIYDENLDYNVSKPGMTNKKETEHLTKVKNEETYSTQTKTGIKNESNDNHYFHYIFGTETKTDVKSESASDYHESNFWPN